MIYTTFGRFFFQEFTNLFQRFTRTVTTVRLGKRQSIYWRKRITCSGVFYHMCFCCGRFIYLFIHDGPTVEEDMLLPLYCRVYIQCNALFCYFPCMFYVKKLNFDHSHFSCTNVDSHYTEEQLQLCCRCDVTGQSTICGATIATAANWSVRHNKLHVAKKYFCSWTSVCSWTDIMHRQSMLVCFESQ